LLHPLATMRAVPAPRLTRVGWPNRGGPCAESA
jgi:hypothetical protein